MPLAAKRKPPLGREEAKMIPLALQIAHSIGPESERTTRRDILERLRESHPGYDPRCRLNLNVLPW